MRKNKKIFLMMSVLVLLPVASFAQNAFTDSLGVSINPDEVTTTDTSTKVQSSTAPTKSVVKKTATVLDSKPAVSKPSLGMVSNSHGLDEIIYKVSRSIDNLKNYPDELSGHRDLAISHLEKALAELKEARK